MGWSCPGGSHQFSLYHAELGIEMYRNASTYHSFVVFELFRNQNRPHQENWIEKKGAGVLGPTKAELGFTCATWSCWGQLPTPFKAKKQTAALSSQSWPGLGPAWARAAPQRGQVALSWTQLEPTHTGRQTGRQAEDRQTARQPHMHTHTQYVCIYIHTYVRTYVRIYIWYRPATPTHDSLFNMYVYTLKHCSAYACMHLCKWT